MSDPFFEWLSRLIFVLAGVLGIPERSTQPARAPEAAWTDSSPRCHVVCWYAGTLGCHAADDCGAWCAHPGAMAACTQPLDALFACVRSQSAAVRDCDPEVPDPGSDLACGAERKAARECMTKNSALR